QVPGAPTLTSATRTKASNNSGDVSSFAWTAPSGSPTQYLIQVASDSAFTTLVLHTVWTSTSYTLANQGCAPTLFHSVTASNASASGASSTILRAAVPAGC